MTSQSEKRMASGHRPGERLKKLGALMFWVCLFGFIILLLVAVLHLFFPLA